MLPLYRKRPHDPYQAQPQAFSLPVQRLRHYVPGGQSIYKMIQVMNTLVTTFSYKSISTEIGYYLNQGSLNALNNIYHQLFNHELSPKAQGTSAQTIFKVVSTCLHTSTPFQDLEQIWQNQEKNITLSHDGVEQLFRAALLIGFYYVGKQEYESAFQTFNQLLSLAQNFPISDILSPAAQDKQYRQLRTAIHGMMAYLHSHGLGCALDLSQMAHHLRSAQELDGSQVAPVAAMLIASWPQKHEHGQLLTEQEHGQLLTEQAKVSSSAACQLGHIYDQQGALICARQMYEQAQKLGSFWADYYLGNLYERQGFFQKASLYYQDAAQNTYDPQALTKCAFYELDTLCYEAIRKIRIAHKQNPDVAQKTLDIIYNRAQTAIQQSLDEGFWQLNERSIKTKANWKEAVDELTRQIQNLIAQTGQNWPVKDFESYLGLIVYCQNQTQIQAIYNQLAQSLTFIVRCHYKTALAEALSQALLQYELNYQLSYIAESDQSVKMFYLAAACRSKTIEDPDPTGKNHPLATLFSQGAYWLQYLFSKTWPYRDFILHGSSVLADNFNDMKSLPSYSPLKKEMVQFFYVLHHHNLKLCDHLAQTNSVVNRRNYLAGDRCTFDILLRTPQFINMGDVASTLNNLLQEYGLDRACLKYEVGEYLHHYQRRYEALQAIIALNKNIQELLNNSRHLPSPASQPGQKSIDPSNPHAVFDSMCRYIQLTLWRLLLSNDQSRDIAPDVSVNDLALICPMNEINMHLNCLQRFKSKLPEIDQAEVSKTPQVKTMDNLPRLYILYYRLNQVLNAIVALPIWFYKRQALTQDYDNFFQYTKARVTDNPFLLFKDQEQKYNQTHQHTSNADEQTLNDKKQAYAEYNKRRNILDQLEDSRLKVRASEASPIDELVHG